MRQILISQYNIEFNTMILSGFIYNKIVILLPLFYLCLYMSSVSPGPVFTKKRSGSGSSDPDFIYIGL
jgi:hypothetical protein